MFLFYVKNSLGIKIKIPELINLMPFKKGPFFSLNKFQMKNAFFVRMIALVCIGVLFSGHSWAQDDKSKRPSAPAVATGKIKDAMITIDYSSPSVKGRKIYGGLVPFDKVWRAGANEATIFTTS